MTVLWEESFAAAVADQRAAARPQPRPSRVLRALQSRQVTVQPLEFNPPSGTKPIRFRTYADLTAAYSTYAALLADNATYADLMQGHPGHDGGVPELPGGTGVDWGVEVDNVEWWLTDAEGLDDSPTWDARTDDNAAGNGSWLSTVRAPGREVTLRGSLVSADPNALADAKALVAACLAARPHTGWLTYAGRRLSIAVAGQAKVKHAGNRLVEVEQTFRGVDIGTPGAGVFLESPDALRWPVTATPTVFVNDGRIPSPAVIRLIGPQPAGVQVWIAQTGIALTAPLVAGETMLIDTRTRAVTINDNPGRSRLDVFQRRWPVVPVGAVSVSSKGTPTQGSVFVDVTRLW